MVNTASKTPIKLYSEIVEINQHMWLAIPQPDDQTSIGTYYGKWSKHNKLYNNTNHITVSEVRVACWIDYDIVK